MNINQFKDKTKAVLYGTAYGDALGAPVEKLTYQEIKARYGRVTTINTEWYKQSWKDNARKRGHGTVTDDTLMTIALMNIYNEKKRHLDAWDMSESMVREIAFKKMYIPELEREDFLIERLFYPEKWIFIRNTLANACPREAGIGNMINCGAAMYIAPVGIVNACNPESAYDEAINFASGHQASYGLEAAGVLAACVAKAFEDKVTVDDVVKTAISLAKDGTKSAIRDIYEKALSLKKNKYDHDLVVSEFQQILKKYSPMGDDVHRKAEKLGIPTDHYTPSRIFSIEELPIALAYCVLHDGNFDDAVTDGINSGRDTDSIGVMAAVILGAMHGMQVFRQADIRQLNVKNRIDFDSIAEQFSDTAAALVRNDYMKQKQVFDNFGFIN